MCIYYVHKHIQIYLSLILKALKIMNILSKYKGMLASFAKLIHPKIKKTHLSCVYVFKPSIFGNLMHISPERNNKSNSKLKEYQVAESQIQLLSTPLQIICPESKEGPAQNSRLLLEILSHLLLHIDFSL